MLFELEALECRTLLSSTSVTSLSALPSNLTTSSAPSSGTAVTVPIAPPADSAPTSVVVAPTHLSAQTVSSSQVLLTWINNTPNSGARIEVLRSNDGVKFTNLVNLSSATIYYVDTQLTAATKYFYEVAALNSAGTAFAAGMVMATTTASPAAPPASLLPPPTPTVPAPVVVAPTGLTTEPLSSSQVLLTWTNSTPNNATNIEVLRSTDGIHFANLITLGATATSYTDTQLTASTQYYYEVAALNSAGTPSPSGSMPATTAALILPGTGFTGPTVPDPTVQHVDPTQAGSNELAIANWDVVPNQTFSGLFNVGVVAFQMNGIKEVDFSVNGGAWVKVTQMTLNPQTANQTGVGNTSAGVVEYWATLDASTFPVDGQVQVRAVAYPTNGQARVLNTLYLNSNKNGTLNQRYVYVSPTGNDATADGTAAHPYQTILAAATYNTGGFGHNTPADNVTIYLEQGDYAWPSAVFNENPSNSTGWLTVTAAPGVNPATARITSVGGSSGFNAALVHLENVTVGNGTNGVVLSANPNLSQSLWVDQVNWAGPGPAVNLNGVFYNGFTGGVYFTDVYSHDTSSHINATLVRNCAVNNGVIAYQNVGTLINSTASDLTIPAGSNFHSDVLQYYETTAGWGNVIIYGLTATQGPLIAQGITLGPAGCIGVAIVNCDVAVTGVSTAFASQSYAENLLILNSTFSGPVSGWAALNGTPFSATDVVIENTLFPTGVNLALQGVTIVP